jgi:hypothetical protein
MGCSSSRSELTAEEATSYNLDILLGYYKSSASRAFKVHMKHSTEGLISEKQFKSISDKLGLFELSSNTIQPILNFYSDFKSDIYHYSLEKLLIFSIIQSSGSTHEKTQLLFKVFSCGNQEVKRGEMVRFVEFILELFISMLTKIKVNDSINDLTYDDMKNFSIKLRKQKNTAQDEIIRIYLEERETINEKDFLEISSKCFSEDFFSGHGIRSYLKKSATRKH